MIKYAVGYNSLSQMIFSGEIPFTNILLPSFGLTEKSFLEKLKISHWSYTDFVISAILFYIKYELTQGSSSFFILSQDIVYLLFNENSLGEEVFTVLKITNLFNFYKDDALAGINKFFRKMISMTSFPKGYRWNTLGISRILSVFDSFYLFLILGSLFHSQTNVFMIVFNKTHSVH